MANGAFDALNTGCVKALAAQLTIGRLTPAALLSAPERILAVPADPNRAFVDHAEYRALHKTGRQRDEHGFAYVDPQELAASDGHASYYSFSPRKGIRMIAIDTVSEGGIPGPSADGNIDDPQFQWLTRELDKAQAKGELVILFGHHPIRSLGVPITDEVAGPCLVATSVIDPGCDRDPRSSSPIHQGEDLKALLHAHRNVIAYVAGHTHEHKITAFPREGGGGFWGIETASEVDWPIQSRLLEVMDNRDGTLSIIGTVLDNAGPLGVPASGSNATAMGESTLAAIGRTLSFNDFQLGGGTGIGEPQDRNVELLLPDPR
jgi:hypothetical protein